MTLRSPLQQWSKVPRMSDHCSLGSKLFLGSHLGLLEMSPSVDRQSDPIYPEQVQLKGKV